MSGSVYTANAILQRESLCGGWFGSLAYVIVVGEYFLFIIRIRLHSTDPFAGTIRIATTHSVIHKSTSSSLKCSAFDMKGCIIRGCSDFIAFDGFSSIPLVVNFHQDIDASLLSEIVIDAGSVRWYQRKVL